MKSFIKLFILILLSQETSALGINIYHNDDLETAMTIYNSFQTKGIPEPLLTVINKNTPCSMTYENSFIDICVNEEKKMKIIRKTSWLNKSLKPLKQEQPGL